MSSLVPALVAVLLAETGGRARALARMPRMGLADLVMVFAVSAAAVGGVAVAPIMNANARALMIGLALALAAAGQLRNSAVESQPLTPTAAVALPLRTNAPFLAFAFAIWRGEAAGAAIGTLAGMAAAALLSSLLPDRWMRAGRLAAMAALALTGIVTMLGALRLVG